MAQGGDAALWGILAGLISGLVSSFVANLGYSAIIESKKQQIADYNRVVDRLLSGLERYHEAATRYWLASQHTPLEHMAMLKISSDILADVSKAFELQKEHFSHVVVMIAWRRYWTVITQPPYASTARAVPDPKIVESALQDYNEVRNRFEESRYTGSLWGYMFPGGKIRSPK